MQIMQKSNEIKEILRAILKGHGFKEKSSNWYHIATDVVQVINLQKSQYGNQYYLNFGIAFRSLGASDYPKENQCHVRFRLAKILTEDVGARVTDAFDLDSNVVSDTERQVFICKVLEENALPFLSKLSSASEVVSAIENGKLVGAFVHRQIKG